MPRAAHILEHYRLPALAVLVSTAVHAAMVVGIPARPAASSGEDNGPTYTATLDPAAPGAAPVSASRASVSPAPRPAARKPHPRRALPLPVPAAQPEPIPEPEPPPPEQIAEAPPQPGSPAEPQPEILKPEVVAMAQPVAPAPPPDILPAKEREFPVEGLPARLSIQYDLKSAVADARAEYHWRRDGDSYRITGEGEAVGFFTLFLEGRILQESTGTVTATGLRPDRFTEKKPNTADEGLAFDWPAHTVTFERGASRNTTPLNDNTVDWLSMIFQLAHVPPPEGAESMQLRVFTQRRLYKFDLKVLGVEEIDIPMGRVRALHLRHVDPEDRQQTVDVWLGIDQHHLPVKMRYPVARNRFMVEQSATRVSER
jgi:hypothetical protein